MLFIPNALITLTAITAYLLPSIKADAICKQVADPPPALARSMSITESYKFGGMIKGTFQQTEDTYHYINRSLPNWKEVVVQSITSAGNDINYITLSDAGPAHNAEHNIVFQLTRQNSDRASYIIYGPSNYCTIKYSGLGSKLLDVAAYVL